MSTNWVKDIADMHEKFHVRTWTLTKAFRKPTDLMEFLRFRISFLDEELSETKVAVLQGNADEVVDGLIDLCVVAIGTMDALGINPQKAWDAVLEANMQKEVGIKASRPNPLGLPDMIKPEGWKAPTHKDNTGYLEGILPFGLGYTNSSKAEAEENKS